GAGLEGASAGACEGASEGAGSGRACACMRPSTPKAPSAHPADVVAGQRAVTGAPGRSAARFDASVHGAPGGELERLIRVPHVPGVDDVEEVFPLRSHQHTDDRPDGAQRDPADHQPIVGGTEGAVLLPTDGAAIVAG